MATNDLPRDGTQGPERVGVYPSGTAGTAGASAGAKTGAGTEAPTTRTVEAGRTDTSYYAAQVSSSPMRWAVPVIAAVVIILALIWLL